MATSVEANVTGTVFQVETRVGSRVKEGDVLIVIESMKMELPIESPAAGRVAEVRVETGQRVEEGDVLVVLE